MERQRRGATAAPRTDRASAPRVCLCTFNPNVACEYVIPYYFSVLCHEPLPVLNHREDSESVKPTRVNVLQLRNSN